jgi:N-acetylgalactosamine-6-sulfatase
MNRRSFLQALAMGAARAAFPQSKRPPNIVFFLADDLGWGDPACYGNPQIKTPSIDRLAKEGTLFTQFYANAPVCSPSRCAFMTGSFPGRLGIHSALFNAEINQERGQKNFLDPKIPTITSLLKQAGYATAHFGKWHLGSGPNAPDVGAYGIDDHITVNSNDTKWDQKDPYFRAKSTGLIVDESIRFIEKNRDKPFYVNAWSLLPHAVLNPTEEQMKPYAKLGPKGVPFKGALQIYYASVTAMDLELGRLLRRLDELGLAENTVVFLSSDNGPEDIHLVEASHSGVGSTGPFRGRKRSLYEGGIRMPFIVRWPGRIKGRHVDNTSVMAGVDFLPTVASLTGTALPKAFPLDGENKGSVLLEGPRPRSKPLFWEWRLPIIGDIIHRSPRLATRVGDWKLLMNPDRSRVELYDIPHDATELDNQAKTHPDVVERLAPPLLAWQKSLPQGPIHPLSGRNDYPWPKE